MSLAERLSDLEQEVRYRAAILDGNEAETREATVTVFGLLIKYLSTKGTLDLADMAAFLATCADPDVATEDHNGRLIHQLRQTVEFHRDNALGLVETHVPLDQRLTPSEISDIRSEVLSTASSARPDRKRRTKKAKRTGRRVGSSVH